MHENWIAGAWQRAAGGGDFGLRGRVTALERWPRSKPEDVARALESCASAQPAWSALGRERRREFLTRAAASLEAGPIAAALEVDLSMDAGELGLRIDEDLFRFREALEILREGQGGDGVGVFHAHWSDWVGGIGMRVASDLLAGRTVLLHSDSRSPRCAEFLAHALHAAGLPAGVAALLHDDGRESRDALLASRGLTFVRWKDVDGELDVVERAAQARVETSWLLWRAHNRSHIVARHADAAREAACVIESFVGRSSTISAQHPGAVARVLCHERIFSRFTAELLGQLETTPDVHRPVPALDDEQDAELARAWSQGLDEGATPIFGGPPGERTDARAIVFTNVDPRSGLARRTHPAPVLGLLRVADEFEALELQRELDGAPKRTLRAARP